PRSTPPVRPLDSIRSRRSGTNSVAFVDVHGLNKVYHLGAQRIHVLRDLELRAAYGERVAIVGPSGCGKTTLLHLLGGIDRADSGQIIVADTNLRTLDD